MKLIRNVHKHLLLIGAMVISALVLLICSKSSPLYPMNDWVDVHCFLTLGKGLLNGMIPYVDLYEQKGPVLYFIYAIVALFCQKGMFGQYLLEVVTFGLFLYFSAKLAGLYLGENSKFLYPLMAVLAAIVATTYSFCHGGSVEQMCLFMFIYGLYSTFKAHREARPLTFREALTNGILAGLAFWIKYTLFGFYIGLALFVLIWYLVCVRDLKKLLATIGQFFLGFGAVSAVVLVFFLCVGGIKALFTCYFYNNLFLYDQGSDGFSLMRIWTNLRNSMISNKVFPFILFLGLGFLLFFKKKRWLDFVAVMLTFGCLTFFTLISHNYPYYSLVLSAYTVFGLTGLVWVVQDLGLGTALYDRTKGNRVISTALICISVAACLVPAYKYSKNTYLMEYDKEDLPQYKFAEIINQTEDATVLNFGFLDGGFYHAADVLPNCYFFCTFNVDAPEMWKTQFDYVKNHKVDYVITRHYELAAYGLDNAGYELVATDTMYFEGVDYVYYLYKLKGEPQ